ncbi:hypothetical protein C8Q75DRAFT_769284 [Abortiporus biennis]|nr:hypothetical protein C8Q75DRAFT_769284 [Abortiporus biennis]
MAPDQKLTKKQKKALAFRDRKGKWKATSLDFEENAVPIIEDEDGDAVPEVEGEKNVEKSNEKSKAVMVEGSGKKEKKRKRSEEEGEQGTQVEAVQEPKVKKQKTKTKAQTQSKAKEGEEGEGESGGDDLDKEDSKVKSKSKANVKQRFILFVGNLKYSTTKETIQKHFSACEPPPSVRLITPKASAMNKPTAKSKGCAFLEFPTKVGLQQALKLHNSELEGRNINVELTAGGGGKSDNRLAKLRERNKELHEQRKKRLAKQNSKSKGEHAEGEVQMDRPQRYSATSGVDQVPITKRTWTVGNTPEEMVSVKKRGSKNKKPPKAFGTGVNAIPVG